MRVREYRAGDAVSLAHLCRFASRETAAMVYGPEQVRTWSSFAEDIPDFSRHLGGSFTLCKGMRFRRFQMSKALAHAALASTRAPA